MTSPSSPCRSGSRLRAALVASLLAGSHPGLLRGEDLCRRDQTVPECAEDITSRASREKGGTASLSAEAAAAAAAREADEAIAAATTGAPQGRAFSSTFTNFASALTGAFDVLDVSRGSGAITLELRLPAPPGARARLQGVVREPAVSDEVVGAAPEEKRAEARASLEKRLGDFDDSEVNLLVEIAGKAAARRLAGELVAEAVNGVGGAARSAQSVKARLGEALEKIDPDGTRPYANLKEDERKLVDPLLRELGDSETSVLEARKRVRRVTRTDRLGELLANESQLYATVGYAWRDPLVGRKGLTAKLTWEYGFSNLTRFRRAHAGLCRSGDRACLEAFAAWVDREGSAGLRNADRAVVSVDYSGQPAYAVSQPGFGIELEKERAWSLRIQAKYSRNLLGGGVRTPVRLDLGAGWEDVRDDPARNDRFVATGTITVRLSDTLQLPVGLVYANRPEYVGEVDKRLGAHIGLVFRPAE